MTDRVLLTGATGFLGHYIADEVRRRGLTVVTAGRPGAGCDVDLDLGQPGGLAGVSAAVAPDAVINCAAMSSVAECQGQPVLALQVNGKSPRLLAEYCGCRFLQVSTDLVFSGGSAPYHASAAPRPLSVYGMSKADGEKIGAGDWLVVRVPLLFGPSYDGAHGATDMLRRAAENAARLTLFGNEYRTPLHAADAARGILDLLLDAGARGIRHLGGYERLSRWELAQRFLAVSGLSGGLFSRGSAEDPRRPKDVSLFGDWQPDRDLDTALRGC